MKIKRVIIVTLTLVLPMMAVAQQGVSSSVKATPAVAKPAHIKPMRQQIATVLTTLTSKKNSPLQKRLQAEKKVYQSPFGMAFYEPTYILPYYYTGDVLSGQQTGYLPKGDHGINQDEFKFQFSVQMPLVRNLFGWPLSLNVAYTQLSYWQFYSSSQFFRETNYEPAVFLSDNFFKNWLISAGVVHQSNGRGGEFERSWNRTFMSLSFSGNYWFVQLEGWALIFQKNTSDIDNPDIARYLGYGRMVLGVKAYHQELSLKLRNVFESGFRRGALELDYRFPLVGHVHGFLQYFTGYGQSLIEYKHYTNSFGLGISVSDWV